MASVTMLVTSIEPTSGLIQLLKAPPPLNAPPTAHSSGLIFKLIIVLFIVF